MEEISLVVVYVSLVKKKNLLSKFILYGFDRHIYWHLNVCFQKYLFLL